MAGIKQCPSGLETGRGYDDRPNRYGVGRYREEEKEKTGLMSEDGSCSLLFKGPRCEKATMTEERKHTGPTVACANQYKKKEETAVAFDLSLLGQVTTDDNPDLIVEDGATVETAVTFDLSLLGQVTTDDNTDLIVEDGATVETASPAEDKNTMNHVKECEANLNDEAVQKINEQFDYHERGLPTEATSFYEINEQLTMKLGATLEKGGDVAQALDILSLLV